MSTKIANLAELLILWGVVGGVIFSLFQGLAMVEGSVFQEEDNSFDNGAIVFQENALSAKSPHYIPQEVRASLKGEEPETYQVIITAYSSSPYETDSSPYITASGDWVQDGTVAANFLPFGTKLKIPELFGDKVFVVKDRMHPRKGYQVDVWFPTRAQALHFGAYYTYIELVNK